MIRAVLFDLDDTLYRALDFVRGGFRAVARELAARGLGREAALRRMLQAIHLTEGPDGVLDKLAARLGVPPPGVATLVTRYRAHRPAIALAPDAVRALARLRQRYRLGCVTDGWAAVQRRKIEALGVAPLLDVIVVADEHGRAHWKPSPVPLLRCCRLLGVTPAESVYVGDNPERDVRGARNAGMASVRIRRAGGAFCAVECADARPDAEIVSLDELDDVLAALDGATAGDARRTQ